MLNIFDREIKLIGDEAFNKLKNSKVILFGLGGVGSYTFEALIRSGIGRIDVVDKDIVDETNINRQLIADITTIGLKKVNCAKERGIKINPNCEINTFDINYEVGDIRIDFKNYDYIIDAIDDVKAKIDIIKRAKELGLPVISCMGTGSKLATNFKVSDISKTSVCPLAKVIRKELKNLGIKDVKVIYSEEEPIKGLDKIGSISYVTGVAGLILSSEVIKDLIKWIYVSLDHQVLI